MASGKYLLALLGVLRCNVCVFALQSSLGRRLTNRTDFFLHAPAAVRRFSNPTVDISSHKTHMEARDHWQLGNWLGIPVRMHWTVLIAFVWLYLIFSDLLATA